MITKEFNTDLAVENILGLLPKAFWTSGRFFEQVVGVDIDHGLEGFFRKLFEQVVGFFPF